MIAKKNKEFLVFLLLNLALGSPAAVAVFSIRTSQVHLDPSLDPSPLGYFRSLALFLCPAVIFGAILFVPPFPGWTFDARTLRSLNAPFRRKAFVLSLLLLCPMGILLDVLFGSTFFKFPESSGVLGNEWPFRFPAYFPNGRGVLALFSRDHWKSYIPVEEFAFYTLGFVTILLTYVWSENVLFRDGKVEHGHRTPGIFRSLGSTALTWGIIGLILSLAGYAVRMMIPSEAGGRVFPGYWLFLIWTALLPSMVLFHVSYHFINWKALTVSWLFVLSISQFWEGCLGVPYQWWDYNHDLMLGIFIRPQCDLPIEAVLVWSLASWTAVVVYERILAHLNIRQIKAGVGPPSGEGLLPEPGSPSMPPGSPASLDQHVARLKELYKAQLE